MRWVSCHKLASFEAVYISTSQPSAKYRSRKHRNMRNTSIHNPEHLNYNEIKLLTRLLSLPPDQGLTEEWLKDQKTTISRFPTQLLRPSSFMSRLSIIGKSTLDAECDPHLCRSHKLLSPHLIDMIFFLVRAETTVHIETLAQNKEKLSPEVLAFLSRMEAVNSLWMDPDLYRVKFGATPYDARHGWVASGCEACILAAVGGDYMILHDLRASIVGRRKKRPKRESRLLNIVEGWLDASKIGDELRSTSDQLGREIRPHRKMLRAERINRREERSRAERTAGERCSSRRTKMMADEVPLLGGEMKNNNNLYTNLIKLNNTSKPGDYCDSEDGIIIPSYTNDSSTASCSLTTVIKSAYSTSRPQEYVGFFPEHQNDSDGYSESNYSDQGFEEACSCQPSVIETEGEEGTLANMYRNLARAWPY